MNLHIRPATTDDGPAIISLLKTLDVGTLIREEEESVTVERIHRHLQLATADDSHLVLLALDDNQEVIGYCAVHWLPYLILVGVEGFVSELFIRPDHRGQGTGQYLMEAITDEARTRGCSRMTLLNMRSRESYERRFYEQLGWQERPDAANFVLRFPDPPSQSPVRNKPA